MMTEKAKNDFKHKDDRTINPNTNQLLFGVVVVLLVLLFANSLLGMVFGLIGAVFGIIGAVMGAVFGSFGAIMGAGFEIFGILMGKFFEFLPVIIVVGILFTVFRDTITDLFDD